MAQSEDHYDPDIFDSMAVVNSETWNTGHVDGSKYSKTDILPHGVSGLEKDELEEAFLSSAEHGVLDLIKEIHTLCGDDIINCVDSDLYTPLHRASYNGHIEVVEYLLLNGARIDSQTIDGWQPLHCACRWNKTKVADLLLQNGALINAQTNGKQTPLHLASSNDRARETLLLLLMNPDLKPDLQNGQGDTAFDVAQRCGNYGNLFMAVKECVDYRKFLSASLHSSS